MYLDLSSDSSVISGGLLESAPTELCAHVALTQHSRVLNQRQTLLFNLQTLRTRRFFVAWKRMYRHRALLNGGKLRRLRLRQVFRPWLHVIRVQQIDTGKLEVRLKRQAWAVWRQAFAVRCIDTYPLRHRLLSQAFTTWKRLQLLKHSERQLAHVQRLKGLNTYFKIWRARLAKDAKVTLILTRSRKHKALQAWIFVNRRKLRCERTLEKYQKQDRLDVLFRAWTHWVRERQEHARLRVLAEKLLRTRLRRNAKGLMKLWKVWKYSPYSLKKT